ncbi:TPA: hypothetical protein H6V66_003078 [Escherichia coli]|nr:hypothetical protein [Escherichia coli]
MKLSLSPPPYADAPVVVLISGLGGSGSYWLPQLAVLEQEYQVVCYDQRGTGNNPDTLALAHFQGKNNLLRRLNALKRADFSHHADRIRCPVQIICASDDLLVPTACSSELHAALPDSQKMVMPYGGHACNVTDPETFNALLLNGLASLLHHREAAL